MQQAGVHFWGAANLHISGPVLAVAPCFSKKQQSLCRDTEGF